MFLMVICKPSFMILDEGFFVLYNKKDLKDEKIILGQCKIEVGGQRFACVKLLRVEFQYKILLKIVLLL